MTAYEKAIAKIQALPEPLIAVVNDFIDFLQLKQDDERWNCGYYLKKHWNSANQILATICPI